MPIAAGTRFGPYEIIALLGAGGMGEVYRAKDPRLGRDVALKVLPPEVAASKEHLARFEREARAIAAINHPNIVVLYSVEDAGGVPFLTMELIEGRTLDRSIAPTGLPIARVLEIGVAIADALVSAHEKGVVHRDLKPGNVMLTSGGRIKVLDFGLAKLQADTSTQAWQATKSTAPVTTEGAVMGTAPYMAPEQIRGGAVDSRTDLFALGVVLYELATGGRPFAGDTLIELSTAILRDSPPAIRSVRGDLPSELERIVGRCLEKDPDRRVQTAKDVRNELDALRRASESFPAQPEALTVPGFGGRPAIAVLPFENRSGDPEQEFFTDGLAEDLTARLSLWRAFPVIASNSSFTYKGRAVDLKQMSAELGVRYVVQGSVRKAGNRVRIAAQLVDAVTGQNVWAQNYDRELTDVFAVQDEISEAIAASLMVDLNRAEYEHVRHHTPDSLEAWGLYQRAGTHVIHFTRASFGQARELLERATRLDPQFSCAWARLSEVGVWEFLNVWTDAPERTLADAVAQARHALELDPRDAEAHVALSFALMSTGDGLGALEHARRGLDVNPSHVKALLHHAYMGHMTGHPPEKSIEQVQRAMRLSPRDPLEWLCHDVLASGYFNAGRFEDGLAAGRRLIALYPDYYFGFIWSAMNAVELGQLELARSLVREARRLVPDLSIPMLRRGIGGMSPEVERNMMGAIERAGLE
jgi:serine/threonine-protein kinase